MKPDFISAWTLIGHEYLELRNFTQAIHSYHKGTTLDPNDCRAWFGLGKGLGLWETGTPIFTQN